MFMLEIVQMAQTQSQQPIVKEAILFTYDACSIKGLQFLYCTYPQYIQHIKIILDILLSENKKQDIQ